MIFKHLLSAFISSKYIFKKNFLHFIFIFIKIAIFAYSLGIDLRKLFRTLWMSSDAPQKFKGFHHLRALFIYESRLL